MKQANYYSPEFYKILATINDVLNNYNINNITAEQGRIFDSKYNKGKYGNTKIWRITNKECNSLFDENMMFALDAALKNTFPEYMRSKIITIGNPRYTKDFRGDAMSSIVIMITELPDNVITTADLYNFRQNDDAAVKKCEEIESRMFKRDGDLRDPATRIEDFAFSLVYEPKLVNTPLIGVSNLTLKHQTNAIILETDTQTDFSGVINNRLCNIEGKSTKARIPTAGFAEYIANRFADGSLGSVHGADYVLLVIKQTGDVICVNPNDTRENWYAGKISL